VRTESLGRSYLALPDGPGQFPGVVVVHEAFGLNDNIRGICARFAAEGYAALGVDLFEGRSRAVCMARMFAGGLAAKLDHYGVPALKAALGQLASHPEVDAARIGAIGFGLVGSIVLTWACTDNRLAAIAPFYGAAPRPRAAIRRMCPVVGSWPAKDFTTKAAGVLETELTAAGIPHDLKVYPAPSMRSSMTSGAPTTPPRRPTPGSGSWLFSPSTSGEALRDRTRVNGGELGATGWRQRALNRLVMHADSEA
jgi:carboxymethylenebutenolidase